MSPTQLAYDAILKYLTTSEVISPPSKLPEEFRKQAGVFVSIQDSDGELRGCIGTYEPTKDNIALEIIDNAIAAATEDFRFRPLEPEELNTIKTKVDVLSQPEMVEDISTLNPQKFGIIVSTSDGHRGVLLPDLEDIDTVEKQIAACRRKASIGFDEPITLHKFSVERFE